MKKPILFICFILLVAAYCFAQNSIPATSDTANSSFKRGLGMYLIFPKFEFTSSSNFNTLLDSYDYPALPRHTFNWGIGLQYRTGSFLVNSDAMLTQQRRDDGAVGTQLERQVLSTNVNLSYYVYKSEYSNRPGFFALYPFTGLSTNDTNLHLSRPSQDRSIEDLLENPENTLQLAHFAVGINIGLGIDFVSNYDDGFAFVSFRLGYRISPEGAYPWESQFTTISNPPSDSFNHFFIQFNLGGGFGW